MNIKNKIKMIMEPNAQTDGDIDKNETNFLRFL